MSDSPLTVLVVGATGSIGQPVLREALSRGHHVRALTRNQSSRLPHAVEVVTGDITDAGSLTAAVAGIDAVVFTHGAHGCDGFRDVDYGGVRNVLTALAGRPVRIALMTAIGVTGHGYGSHDWKRRSERLVRASGSPYTIVRPGWFDYNDADQHQLHLLQGDTRHAGSPADGVIARDQIAQVLVAALASEPAAGKTFELVAEHGPAQPDLDPLFAALQPDSTGSVDGVRDADTLPLDQEPDDIRRDLQAVRERHTA